MFIENARKTANECELLIFVVSFNIRKYSWIFENFNSRNMRILVHAGVSSCHLAMWPKIGGERLCAWMDV